MKLLELVFSASYYETHFPGVVGLVDFGSSFEHYQIHVMPSCFPPSEYFEQHPEILKPDGIHCVISDWQDVGFAHHKMIEEYLQKNNIISKGRGGNAFTAEIALEEWAKPNSEMRKSLTKN